MVFSQVSFDMKLSENVKRKGFLKSGFSKVKHAIVKVTEVPIGWNAIFVSIMLLTFFLISHSRHEKIVKNTLIFRK